MAKLLLDSTVHIQWARGRSGIVDWFRRATDEGHDLLTSAVSVAEIYSAAHEREVAVLAAYFEGLTVAPLMQFQAVVAGRLRYRLARQGRQLQLADSLIAATAIDLRATVVTANVKDFELAGVPVWRLG